MVFPQFSNKYVQFFGQKILTSDLENPIHRIAVPWPSYEKLHFRASVVSFRHRSPVKRRDAHSRIQAAQVFGILAGSSFVGRLNIVMECLIVARVRYVCSVVRHRATRPTT